MINIYAIKTVEYSHFFLAKNPMAVWRSTGWLLYGNGTPNRTDLHVNVDHIALKKKGKNKKKIKGKIYKVFASDSFWFDLLREIMLREETNRKRNPLWKRFKKKQRREKKPTFSVCLCFVVLFIDTSKINYITAGAYVYRDLWSNRFQIKWFYQVSACILVPIERWKKASFFFCQSAYFWFRNFFVVQFTCNTSIQLSVRSPIVSVMNFCRKLKRPMLVRSTLCF